MPKRKATSRIEPRSKKLRTSRTTRAPWFPQEILDNIIDLSLEIDTFLGPLPRDVHNIFLSPFMQVNQACRQRSLDIITSLTWLEISSVDIVHAELVRNLTKHSPVIDSFWVSNLDLTESASRVIFKFGRRSTERVTRQHKLDTRSFVFPYSCASMLHVISEIGFNCVDHVSVRIEKVTGHRLREMEKFLDLSTAEIAQPEEIGIGDLHFHLSQVCPNSVGEMLTVIDRTTCALDELRLGTDYESQLRLFLALLYLGRPMADLIDMSLDSPEEWARLLGQPNWRSDFRARAHLETMHIFYEMERFAFHFFLELLKTKREWTIKQAPFLTNDYHRWAYESQVDYYGLSNVELAHRLHNAGTAIGLYHQLNGWPKGPAHRSTKSTKNQEVEFYYRALFFQSASYLQPEDAAWRQEYLDAKRELFHFFPTSESDFEEPQVFSYVDVEGRECTWHRTDIFNWDTRILYYMSRAQQIVADRRSRRESPD